MPSRARVRWATFRVIVVSTVAVAILLTLMYLLTGGTLFDAKVALYLFLPDASGVDKDSPVRVSGIDVGKVTRVEFTRDLRPERIVRVMMTVERQRLASIPSDSIAEISSDSLIGDKFVDVTAGKSRQPIAANGEIQPKPASPMAKSLDLQQLEAQFRKIEALLDDVEGGKSELSHFVLGTQVYTDLRASVGKIESKFHTAVSSTSQLGQALYTDKVYERAMNSIGDFDATLARLQSGQGPEGALLRDSAQYNSAIKQIEELRKSIAGARASDWMQSDQSYRDWNRALAGFIARVDAVNADRSLNSTAAYEELNGMARQTGATMRDFRLNPRKYLRIKVF